MSPSLEPRIVEAWHLWEVGVQFWRAGSFHLSEQVLLCILPGAREMLTAANSSQDTNDEELVTGQKRGLQLPMQQWNTTNGLLARESRKIKGRNGRQGADHRSISFKNGFGAAKCEWNWRARPYVVLVFIVVTGRDTEIVPSVSGFDRTHWHVTGVIGCHRCVLCNRYSPPRP